MVQIIGRLTRDAEVKQLASEATVVNFTIAVNDWYKPKNGEGKELVEFIQCSYWMNAAIAKSLKKGAVVEAGGRLYATGYMRGNEAVGQINLNAQHVKVHVFAKNEETAAAVQAVQLELQAQEQPQETKNGKGKNRQRPTKPGQKPAPVVPATEVPTDDLPF